MLKLIILVVILTACVSGFKKYEQVDKLTVDETVKVMTIVDTQLIRIMPAEMRESIKVTTEDSEKFNALTGSNLSSYDYAQLMTLREKLFGLMNDHANQKSWVTKMTSLITFQNILLLCAVVTGIATILTTILYIFIDKNVVLFFGTLMSMAMLGIKYTDVDNYEFPLMHVLFIFESYTPIMGLFMFMGVTAFCLNVTDYGALHFFWILLSAGTTIYHEHWFAGVITVMLIFSRFGFYAMPMPGGYKTGFSSKGAMERCMFIATIMVSSYIYAMLKMTDHKYFHYIMFFQTGVTFWGTFVGLLAMLILSDDDYLTAHKYDKRNWAIYQFCMVAACLSTIYFGTVLDISSLKNVAGTFLVLWFLDIEKTILTSNGSPPLFFFTLCVNCLLLHTYITKYPEYFIWG